MATAARRIRNAMEMRPGGDDRKRQAARHRSAASANDEMVETGEPRKPIRHAAAVRVSSWALVAALRLRGRQIGVRRARLQPADARTRSVEARPARCESKALVVAAGWITNRGDTPGFTADRLRAVAAAIASARNSVISHSARVGAFEDMARFSDQPSEIIVDCGLVATRRNASRVRCAAGRCIATSRPGLGTQRVGKPVR